MSTVDPKFSSSYSLVSLFFPIEKPLKESPTPAFSNFSPPSSSQTLPARLLLPSRHGNSSCQGHWWPPHCQIRWALLKPSPFWSIRNIYTVDFFSLNSFLTGLSGRQPLKVLFLLCCQCVLSPSLVISSCLFSLFIIGEPQCWVLRSLLYYHSLPEGSYAVQRP